MVIEEAVILAGGLGTRLRSVLPNVPKPLAEVNGVPFVGWIVRELKLFGVCRVVLCVGHLAEQVESCLGYEFEGIEIVYSREKSPRGTGGALALAASVIKSETVFVLNGDSCCSTDLGLYVNAFENSGASAAMLLTHVDDAGRFGLVDFNDRGLVTAFQEKQPGRQSGWINAGIYLMKLADISAISIQREPLSLERDVLPGWLSRGVFCFRSEGNFIDIGTPESLSQAGSFVELLASSGGYFESKKCQ